MAKQTFENALKQLEEVVRDLEAGELPLEKAIARFEEGMKLSKYCASKLDEIEKKVTLLLKDHQGQILEKPFLEEETDLGEDAL